MKKKIGIIIAILLCVVLVCTFVACKPKKGNENKNEDPTFTVTETEKATMESKIGTYLDEWLNANAQEEGAFSDQKRAMKEDLNTQKAAFSFTNSKNEAINPVFDIKYAAATGKYTITVTWSDGNGTPVTLNFEKDTVPAEYMGWAGNNSRVNDEWLLDNAKASDTLDALVAAGIKTINTVTGNAITGKFGADGVLGVSVAGKTYGLRIAGNIDGTVKTNNQLGLSIVDGDGRARGGIYYKAVDGVENNKLYIQYATTGDDGNLIRDNDGNFTYAYKYISYADIYSALSRFIPNKEANDGVLTFKDEDGEPIEIDGLTTLLAANDIDGSMVNMIVNMLCKTYKNGDRYYIDINLGSVLSQVSGLMKTINLDLSGFGIDLDAMDIDLANLSGLIGHITVSGKVSNEELSDIEVAVNIAKSKLYLNGKRGDDEKAVNIPAISFAVYLEDFTFLPDEFVEDVIPDEAFDAAEYFSPTNFDLSGDIHIVHTELNEQGQVDTDKSLDDTFHFDFVTDINLLEILENGSDSSAKAALAIRQSQGATYDPQNDSNFLTITYEQKDKYLSASGTAFGLDDGETLYSFQITSLDEAKKQIMLWLGLDTEHGNWHGVSSSFELLPYVLTSDTTFKENKKYYVKGENDVYTEATNIVVGADVPADTYYVVPDTYESAKIIFGNSFIKNLIMMIMGSGKASGAVAEAAPDLSNIDGYIDAFKGIYDEFVTEGKIDFDLDGEDLEVKAEITADMINEVIDTINSTFSAEIPHIANPKEVKFYLNYGETYNDKCFISVKYKDNTYELLFDDSVAGKFGIDFKVILKSNRVYEFNFVAEKGTNDWTVTVTFDIVKDGTAETPVIENHTAVTLSNFHGKWGTDTKDRIATLLPSSEAKAASLPIFPSTDIDSVGTQIAKGILKIFSNEKVQQYAMMAIGMVTSFMA